MRVIVAGIDPSLTNTGVAALRNGRPVLLDSIGHPNHNVKDWDNRVRRITSEATAVMLRIHDCVGVPDLTAVEEPLMFVAKSADSYDRYALFVKIIEQLLFWNAPYAVVNNQTRARWATGYGSSAKRSAADPTGSTKRRDVKVEVLEAVRRTWAPWKHHIKDDNQADALTMSEMCARRLDEPLHFRIRLHQVEALHTSIKWFDKPVGAAR